MAGRLGGGVVLDDEAALGRTGPLRPGAASEDAVPGSARLAAALARLGDVDSEPVGEHAPVYEDIAARLHEVLEDPLGDPGAAAADPVARGGSA